MGHTDGGWLSWQYIWPYEFILAVYMLDVFSKQDVLYFILVILLFLLVVAASCYHDSEASLRWFHNFLISKSILSLCRILLAMDSVCDSVIFSWDGCFNQWRPPCCKAWEDGDSLCTALKSLVELMSLFYQHTNTCFWLLHFLFAMFYNNSNLLLWRIVNKQLLIVFWGPWFKYNMYFMCICFLFSFTFIGQWMNVWLMCEQTYHSMLVCSETEYNVSTMIHEININVNDSYLLSC